MVASTAGTSHTRCAWRPCHERAAVRPFVKALAVDEVKLARAVKPLIAEGDREMRRMRQKGMASNEALLQCSKGFSDKMMELCMAAVAARDERAVRLVHERGDDALRALRFLGVLDPPWLTWKSGKERGLADMLRRNLAETLPNREYQLRSRIVRTETAASYSASRLRPRDMASPVVEHVMSAADVARLRAGETLVLDPNPALLPPAGFAAAMADLLSVVKRGGAAKSANPCNQGSFHGMLHCDRTSPPLVPAHPCSPRLLPDFILAGRHAARQSERGRLARAGRAHVRAAAPARRAACHRRAAWMAPPARSPVDGAVRSVRGCTTRDE
jgi:hypothetical protein